jgi:hypothetical protein
MDQLHFGGAQNLIFNAKLQKGIYKISTIFWKIVCSVVATSCIL